MTTLSMSEISNSREKSRIPCNCVEKMSREHDVGVADDAHLHDCNSEGRPSDDETVCWMMRTTTLRAETFVAGQRVRSSGSVQISQDAHSFFAM
jgi:hypothetical protein